MHQRRAAATPAASASSNRYHHIEETRVHRFVVPSNRDSGRSFRSRLLNEQIQYADDRVAFVRTGRVREKNLFPNPGDATDFIEWHMPLVPATIVKRNAVMWNSRSSHSCFFGTAFTQSADHRSLRSLAGFLSAFIVARRTGIEPVSLEGELRALCQLS